MSDAAPAERPDRAWLVWGGIVFGLLGLAIATQLVLVMFAISEPSVAVEPDYYQKALSWNEQREQAALNNTLGWRLELRAGAVRTDQVGARVRELWVTLSDSAGARLDGAQVRLTAFHKARRRQVLEATFVAQGGRYLALLPVRRAGLWELRFQVERGGSRFTQVLEPDLPGIDP